MTALEAVAVHLPSHAVPIEEVGESAGLDPRQIRVMRRFHGLDQVRIDRDGTLIDLMTAAAGALGELNGRAERIHYVLHARSIPVAVPYPLNLLDQVRRDLGLEHALGFTVSHHACATSLLAIDVAGRLLAADGDPEALALILAGEKAFTRDAQVVPETSVFAEGAAACLVRPGGGRDRVLSYAASVRGEFDGRLAEDPDLLLRFQREYPTALAGVIRRAVERAGLTLDDIDLILPHNVNQVSWKRFCRDAGYPLERVLLDNVPDVGHSFAADAFINYDTAVARGLLEPGRRYLIAAAGLGAIFSAMTFEH